MTNGDTRIYPLLPALKEDSPLQMPEAPGSWTPQGAQAFKNVADSLAFDASTRGVQVSSVPTVWSQAIQFELALQDRDYPTRESLLNQWFGGLATLALAQIRNLSIEPACVELDKIDDTAAEPLINALERMLPARDRSLFQLPQNRHPWSRIYVFFLSGKVFGFSSPSAIFVPAQDLQIPNLAWVDQKTGLFRSPGPMLNPMERQAFRFWLEQLSQAVSFSEGDSALRGAITTVIDEFLPQLGEPAQQLSLLQNYYRIPIQGGLLPLLGQPVQAQEQPSSIELVISRRPAREQTIIFYDANIPSYWDVPAHELMVIGSQNLGAFNRNDISRLQGRGVRCLTREDLFLPQLKFILNDELFSDDCCLQPEVRGIELTYQGTPIQPLLPLSPTLSHYFSASELARMITFEQVDNNEGQFIKVQLDLTLSGPARQNRVFRLEQTYPLREENILASTPYSLPVITVWPYLRTPGWKQYYVLSFILEHEDSFYVEAIGQPVPNHRLKDRSSGEGRLIQSEVFPEFLKCLDSGSHDLIGLLMLKLPQEIRGQTEWNVGVDFGTSFTNIYRRSGTTDYRPFAPNPDLIKNVTNVPAEVQVRFLRDYFIPEQCSPTSLPPMATWLTVKEAQDSSRTADTPIMDGRIFVPSFNNCDPTDPVIKTNLKWEEGMYQYNKLFLKNLALEIAASAASEGVNKIVWSLSYPTAFSRFKLNQYANTWETIAGDLEGSTGIHLEVKEQNHPEGFKTESLAIAEYFVKEENQTLVNATCIDIGGGTSDITIWENQRLIYQCSIQLAGRDLFSQFLEKRKRIAIDVFQQYAPIREEVRWKGLRGSSFNALVDIYLRSLSEDLLKQQPQLLADKDYRQLITLMTIGITGLYYYVGLLLKTLHAEGTYDQAEITPMYLGGNGSRFLHWLTPNGRFNIHSETNTLFSRMLALGSGFEDINIKTTLSQNPKDEAACGLVINELRFQEWEGQALGGLIAGEDCIINGKTIKANQRIVTNQFQSDKTINEFQITSLEPIAQFLYDFHRSVRSLKIELVKKLPNYEESTEIKANKTLWKDVERERKQFCQTKQGTEVDAFMPEPPFIISLKALLKVLGERFKQQA